MLHKKRKPSTFTSSSGLTDCKRDTTNNNMLHSKSTYFYRWGSLVPVCCGVALLLGVGIIVNPIVSTEHANAATTNIVTDDTLGTKVDLIMSDTLQSSKEVESGEVAYISNGFSIKVEGKADYHISIQAAEGHGSELVGRNTGEKILGIDGTAVPDTSGSFKDNTWGYALEDTTKTSVPPSSLSYKSMPAYGTLTAPQYSQTDVQDQTNDFKLHFAAKITNYKPSDHYETQALLSVVAEPKEIPKFTSLGNITKMSEMTSAHCKNLATPSATAEFKDIPTGQLIDDREGDDGTKYWVAKLADGNCWMTQNMAYDGISNKTGSFTSSYNHMILEGSSPIEIGSRTLSSKAWVDSPFPDTTTYDGHYRIGNYYTHNYNQATEACDFSGVGNVAWKLPSAPSDKSAPNGSFRKLTNMYGFTSGSNNSSSSANADKMQLPPLYFIYTGAYFKDSGKPGFGIGNWWSDTGPYALSTGWMGVNPSDSYSNDGGRPVRCIVLSE